MTAGPPTARELEVLRVCLYRGNKEAARLLGLHERTVAHHNARLYRRIGVEDRAQAVAWLDDHLPGWREPVAA